MERRFTREDATSSVVGQAEPAADIVIMGERKIARGMVDDIKVHAPVTATNAEDLCHA